jgi:hypothetical protein
MTEWIDFSKEKPKEDIDAFVTNFKGWMDIEMAHYCVADNVWRYYHPFNIKVLLLDVTHYIPIPPSPREWHRLKKQKNKFK